MKKVGILPNGNKPGAFALAKEVAEWLLKNGCLPLVTQGVGQVLELPSECIVKDEDIYTQSAFLAVLGGDGTILRAAGKAAPKGTPLLGLNMGTLGYLTDADAGQALTSLEKALNGDFVIERRMMLQAHVAGDKEGNMTRLALNDVCVLRGVFSAIVTVELCINGKFIDRYRGDGIIVSTPTGSTAYNLSAGGPILKPDAEMMAVTTICPHMIYARPLVVSADDVVGIKLCHVGHAQGMLNLDGQNQCSLAVGQKVTIRRSNYYTSIMKTNNKSFFDILRQKMMGN